eukprot:SAG31_NODE_320_length_17748_cov_4.201881_12_plen_235_part_00
MTSAAAAARASAGCVVSDCNLGHRNPHNSLYFWCPRFEFGATAQVYPLVYRAWRDRFKPEMTPALSPHLASAAVVEKVSALWRAERARANSGKGSASIVPAFRKLMGVQLLNGVLIGVLQGLLSVVFRPIVLNVLIDCLAKPEIPALELVLTVSAFAAVTLGDIWTATFARYYIHVDCGSQFVCATSGLILQKACTVRLSAPSADTGGGQSPGREQSKDCASQDTGGNIKFARK